MKKCKICKTKKDESGFSKDRTRFDGLDNACKECRENYRKQNLSMFNEKNYRWRKNNQEVSKAQITARNIYTERKKCSIETCNEIGERHHLDYSKPLEILWLCKEHHKALHYVIRKTNHPS